MNDLNDLWPDFDVVEQDENEENNALKILREQARILGKKSGNKVKATFSKIHYREVSSGFSSALTAMAAITAASQTKTEEVLEDDLTGKTNVSDVLREQPYKSEFVYHFIRNPRKRWCFQRFRNLGVGLFPCFFPYGEK